MLFDVDYFSISLPHYGHLVLLLWNPGITAAQAIRVSRVAAARGKGAAWGLLSLSLSVTSWILCLLIKGLGPRQSVACGRGESAPWQYNGPLPPSSAPPSRFPAGHWQALSALSQDSHRNPVWSLNPAVRLLLAQPLGLWSSRLLWHQSAAVRISLSPAVSVQDGNEATCRAPVGWHRNTWNICWLGTAPVSPMHTRACDWLHFWPSCNPTHAQSTCQLF